jgi:hypothetical protein
MTNNPLIDKYFELYPEKKEPPKMPLIEDYEGEETIADELKKPKIIKAENAKVTIAGNSSITITGNSSGVICDPNPPSITTYDLDSSKDAFLQIAEKVKNSEAQVVSMGMERDMIIETKIIFEVIVYDD